MTLLHAVEVCVVSLLVGVGGGWWLKGRYAAKAAAELAALSKKV